MVKSMTGFGRGEAADEDYKIQVEMKSVNHRYLDLGIKMPKKFNPFEARIRKLLKKDIERGKTVEELMEMYERNRPFYRGGGITATGGEPLMQLSFLVELFSEAKRRQIHTCLDTSGIVYCDKRKEEFERLFAVTDLVLLDVKHSAEEGHLKLTSKSQKPVLAFAKALEAADIPVIVRHVCVPGITDGEKELNELGRLIGKWRNLKGLDVLAYHTMGVLKYKNLGISYPLEGTADLRPEKAKEARAKVLEGIREVRGRN